VPLFAAISSRRLSQLREAEARRRTRFGARHWQLTACSPVHHQVTTAQLSRSVVPLLFELTNGMGTSV
jgi:hypothetical protein